MELTVEDQDLRLFMLEELKAQGEAAVKVDVI